MNTKSPHSQNEDRVIWLVNNEMLLIDIWYLKRLFFRVRKNSHAATIPYQLIMKLCCKKQGSNLIFLAKDRRYHWNKSIGISKSNPNPAIFIAEHNDSFTQKTLKCATLGTSGIIILQHL